MMNRQNSEPKDIMIGRFYVNKHLVYFRDKKIFIFIGFAFCHLDSVISLS